MLCNIESKHKRAYTGNTKKVGEEYEMKLTEKEIEFIKTNLKNADELLSSSDPNDLIDALDEFSVFTMDENDDITDIGRAAERIIDKIAYSD